MALNGLRILIPESRELDLFAGMLEAQGAQPLRCPLVQIADLDDTSLAQAWIEEMIAKPFDLTVLLTGEGLRKILSISAARHEAFLQALRQTRTVIRGPKPGRALREIGLAPSITAVAPTSLGVAQTLESEYLQDCRVGVQLYPGDGAMPLVETLKARGAQVFTVTPYRYLTQTESEKVAQTIRDMAMGKIDMVAFTSTPQLERLFSVAREFKLEAELDSGLERTAIAAIGPIMERALAERGLKSAIAPASSFHLKPMVKAICEAWKVRA